MATKTKYVARKIVAKFVLLSADEKQTLTLALKEGSGKFNIAATVRDTDKESDTAAQTGARASFSSIEEGKKALETLREDAGKKGWKLQMTSSARGSFTSIPTASGFKGKKANAA